MRFSFIFDMQFLCYYAHSLYTMIQNIQMIWYISHNPCRQFIYNPNPWEIRCLKNIIMFHIKKNDRWQHFHGCISYLETMRLRIFNVSRRILILLKMNHKIAQRKLITQRLILPVITVNLLWHFLGLWIRFTRVVIY